MERQFSGKSFRNCGQPPEVFPFLRLDWNRGIPLPFARIFPFPGPFSQDGVKIWGMEFGVVNGERHSRPVGQ